MAQDPEIAEAELVPVEAAEETPADELLRELRPALSDEDAAELWQTSHRDTIDALADRTPWADNLDSWEKQYLGMLPDKNFPWPGCSNFHVPLTMVGIETLKPRLAMSILSSDPMILVKPTGTTDEDRRDRAELFLNWQVTSEMDVEPLVIDSAHQFLLPGTVVAKVLWKTERRRIKALRRFPHETNSDELFRALFGPTSPADLTQESNGVWTGEIQAPNGVRLPVRVKTKVTETELLALVERDDILYDGPRVELLPIEDFIVPINGGGDVQRLPWCQHRLWLSEDNLRRKVQAGVFDQDAVEALVNVQQATGESETKGTDVSTYKTTLAVAEGTETTPATNVRDQQYEVIEDYRSWDIDDDGFDEEIVFWTSPQLADRILGWDYLDNVCGHGKRPFVVGRFLPIPGRFYGLSFPEIVRGLQEEIDTIHNQRVDSGTIRNTPGYFYRASMTHSPSTHRIRPGEGIPVDNPQADVFIPQWNGSESFGQAEEALLYQYFERATGLNDLALGRQPNRVGATRTAQGTAALMSEAGLRFETIRRNFQRFWMQVFKHVLLLDAQYLPPGKEFRVTGRYPEILRINDRSELIGNYDIQLTGTTESLNKQVMREDAAIKLNTAMNPMVLQFGLVGLKGLTRLLRGFYRAYGESDPDLVVEPSRTVFVRTPQEELSIWADGGDVEPSPQENLEAHFTAHQQQLADPTLEAVLGPGTTAKIRAHISKTIELIQTHAMAASMQQARPGGGGAGPAQAAVAGPQAMNAEIGRTAPQQPTTRTMNAGPSYGA